MSKSIRNVVVVGAFRGIGQALAEEYAASGATLVLLSRDMAALKNICDIIKREGGKAYYHRCDITDKESVAGGIAYAKRTLHRLDLVIVNAGIGEPEWIRQFASDVFERVMAVNVFGLAHVLEAVVPLMIAQHSGIIAGVTSLADVRGYPGHCSYSASKAAASRLLESARVELRRKGVRVVTVRPGWVRTDMTAKNDFPMPFIVSPRGAARRIRRGIARGSSCVQFPFPVVFASRIAGLLPNWVFDRLMPLLRGIPD